MSERITHTAVLDDCLRLVRVSSAIGGPFKGAAQEYAELARLASATRLGDRFTVALLDRLRMEWPNRTPESALEARLAFVMGWLCHRAADREMKPIFRAMDDGSGQVPTECSIYHDVHLLREIYAVDPETPYGEPVLGLREPMVRPRWETMRDLFHTLLQQSLIELHTLVPDADDPWGWIGKLHSLQQRFYVDVTRYAQALAEPDPDKLRRYVKETHFYSEKDPILKLARDIQLGRPIAPDRIHETVSGPATSHYGRALVKGFSYLLSASDFFEGRMDTTQLRERLDIGKPGVDGKPV